jgi:hypothetical protein
VVFHTIVMILQPNQVFGANAGWCWQFCFPVHCFCSGVAQLFFDSSMTETRVTLSIQVLVLIALIISAAHTAIYTRFAYHNLGGRQEALRMGFDRKVVGMWDDEIKKDVALASSSFAICISQLAVIILWSRAKRRVKGGAINSIGQRP